MCQHMPEAEELILATPSSQEAALPADKLRAFLFSITDGCPTFISSQDTFSPTDFNGACSSRLQRQEECNKESQHLDCTLLNITQS